MIKNTKGSSIVSVLAASVILLLLLALFQQSIQLASGMLQKAVDTKNNFSELEYHYYTNKNKNADRDVTLNFAISRNPVSFSVKIPWNSATDPNGTIYYFGNGSTGEGETNTD